MSAYGSNVADFLNKYLDYATWQRSRGLTCGQLAETYGVSPQFVGDRTSRRALELGIDLPLKGRPRKEGDEAQRGDEERHSDASR